MELFRVLQEIVFVVFVFPFMLYSGSEVEDQIPCTPKNFGESSFVCVCNEISCDTLPKPVLPSKKQFLLYSSDKEHHRFFKTVHTFEEKHEVCKLAHPYKFPFTEGKTNLVLDLVLEQKKSYQHIIGWGGAISDAAAANVLSLSAPIQELLLRSYFSDKGLEYNLVRINIGGCDFSGRPYTHVDTKDDLTLETFSLQTEDTDLKIPLIKRAITLAERPIKLLGTPWSAPPWMKTNNAYGGGGRLKDEMYQVWADYIVKFLKNYKEQNVTMWAITLQNEPRVGNLPSIGFNSMGWTAQQQTKWLGENIGPTLEAHRFEDLKVLIMDDTRYEMSHWPKTVMGDPVASKYADGIAVHWYTDSWVSPAKLDHVHELFPDMFIINTEACEGNFPSQPDVLLGSWERAERYARDIIVDMNHWVNGWMDWNIALDMEGGPNWVGNFVDSAVIVNEKLGEFYKNPMFYAMGHFSKFVHEGAKRVGLTLPDIHNLDATAFKNPDGSIVFVLLNSLENEVDVRVMVEDRGTMHFIAAPRSLNTAIFI